MDDTQLERELAALEGAPAETEKPSEAETEIPEGQEGEAETETEGAEADESDAGEEAGEDESGEGEDEKDDKSEEEDKPRKKPSGSERLKRRIAALERELSTRSSRDTDGAVDQSAIEKVIGKPPKEADFNGDFLAFERAQTAYEVRKAIQEDRLREQSQARQSAQADAMRAALDDHAERVEEFKAKVPDFDKTLREVSGKAPISEDLFRLILESDKSAHLVYHLAKNPERIAELNDMSATKAARVLGAIESRLSLPQPKTATKAPKPVTPPKGGARAPSVDDAMNKWLAEKYGKQA